MSLPLSRRVVQAALIVAAGAVPVVAAGSAHAAAPALPTVPDVGGLSQLDTASLGGGVQSAAHE
ncbi:ATP-binding protein, partial [Streptacidiphilus monticola]